MNEIGGYFGLETFTGEEFYPDLLKLNTARNALVYLCRARSIRKVYLPYFLCDSVATCCEREGIPYEQYRIRNDFMPDFQKIPEENEYLYVVNYYGQLSDETLLSLQKQYKNIIVDNVQAFFQRPIPGIDTIYSCRKFFGVPDGAYLATAATLAQPLDTDRSAERMRHILGRYEDCASAYYSDFKENDASFRSLPLQRMSPLTENLLRAVAYQNVMEAREKNWSYLHKKLKNKNKLCPTLPAGPYAYPFYCEDGMEIKKALAREGIYVATLWPNILQSDFLPENAYARNILPLPCDQRYGIEEMEKLSGILSKFC